MGKIKRIIGLVLALAMVLGVIPFNAIEVKAKSQTYTTLQTNDYESDESFKIACSCAKSIGIHDDAIVRCVAWGFLKFAKEKQLQTRQWVPYMSSQYVPNLTELLVDGEVKSLKDIERFKRLKKFVFNHSDLPDVDLSKNTELEYVVMNNCNTKSLKLPGSIKELFCAGNNLETLDVSNLSNLKKLYCDFNKLTKLDLRTNSKLEEISIKGNNLVSLQLPNNNVKINDFDNSHGHQVLRVKIPRKTSKITFTNELSKLDINKLTELQGAIKKDNYLVWDEKTVEDNEQNKIGNIEFKYPISEQPYIVVNYTIEVDPTGENPEYDKAKNLVDLASKNITNNGHTSQDSYERAYTSVADLVIGSGKTELEQDLKAIKKYIEVDNLLLGLESKDISKVTEKEITDINNYNTGYHQYWQQRVRARINALLEKRQPMISTKKLNCV